MQRRVLCEQPLTVVPETAFWAARSKFPCVINESFSLNHENLQYSGGKTASVKSSSKGNFSKSQHCIFNTGNVCHCVLEWRENTSMNLGVKETPVTVFKRKVKNHMHISIMDVKKTLHGDFSKWYSCGKF